MTIRVRQAQSGDIDALASLMRALADYERLPPPTDDAIARTATAAWPTDGTAPVFTAWLAEVQGPEPDRWLPVGYAITFLTWSSFRAEPTMYLEDLFVLPESRGRSLGSLLFRTIAAEAVRLGCGRMDWAVLDWNETAAEFYRKHGAAHLREWHVYRLEAHALAAAAAGVGS